MFVVDTIKGILNSDLSDKDKIVKINEIIGNFERIELKALELSLVEGRKPTINDRLRAVEELAKEKNITLRTGNYEDLREVIKSGFTWLKKLIRENHGWEIRPNLKPVVFENKPRLAIRPYQLLLTSPWDISLAVSTFWDWLVLAEGKEDVEAANLIRKGKAYLKAMQDSLGTGGLGDSLWLSREANRNEPGAVGNTWETGVAILAWSLTPKPEDAYHEAIEWGMKFILNNLQADGGYGFKQGLPSDLKSTALAVICLSFFKGQNLYFLPSAQIDAYLERGLDWILGHQQDDGSWFSHYLSRDSSILPQFYAVPTLLLAKKRLVSENQGKEEEKINLALGKALRWFESSQKYVQDKDKTGWAWGHTVNSSGVENTATALIAIMDAEWKDRESALVQKTLEWLCLQRDPETSWGVTTPAVLKALMRVVEPKLRLAPKLDILWHS